MVLLSVDLNDKQFEKVSRIVYDHAGINLKKGKEALVKARLAKRMRAVGIQSVEAYMKFLESDQSGNELDFMIDVMTTNKTNFFREPAHFDFLRDRILPEIPGGKMRLWSAACSSGEEPYSMAILLRESMPDIDRRDILILATDISRQMLGKAKRAQYSRACIRDIPPDILRKYFTRARNGGEPTYLVNENVRGLIRLAWLNLMDSWPMKGPFDVIFCRNVMIYFDRLTQQKLVNRFYSLLRPGGHLFVGHSEGLTAITHEFKYIRPATYRK
ncbi:MAG: protein-glutamate O-methyltransferase CheR [Desulfobacterales bacterium]|nr:protein-glutamate O-methyltransferase CheR [Desulfobacterales bacterium]